MVNEEFERAELVRSENEERRKTLLGFEVCEYNMTLMVGDKEFYVSLNPEDGYDSVKGVENGELFEVTCRTSNFQDFHDWTPYYAGEYLGKVLARKGVKDYFDPLKVDRIEFTVKPEDAWFTKEDFNTMLSVMKRNCNNPYRAVTLGDKFV